MFEKVIKINMMSTVAIGLVMLYLGKFLRTKVKFFQRFCIPAPVIGGFLFSLIHLILKTQNLASFEMDTTLKDPFMMVFFTSIGLGADIETLKKGGKGFFVFTAVTGLLIILQNFLGMFLAKILKQNVLFGLACGSITMAGGHGTAGAWGPTLESLGLVSGQVISMAAATFGVIMGSLIGGPLGSSLIRRYNLKSNDLEKDQIDLEENGVLRIPLGEKRGQVPSELKGEDFLKTLLIMFIAISIGVIANKIIAKNIFIEGTPLNLPEYVVSMIIAGLYVNTLGKNKIYKIDKRANDICGDIGLNIFLVVALITLDLTQLKSVFGPMLIILFAQTFAIILFAYFIVFRIMGKNYDAAVLAGGLCGFGMGATYNAMANMDSITSEYGSSRKAYFIVPMVGAFALDIINVVAITFFSQFKF